MIGILLVIGGIYMVSQKEVKISSKRSIRGPLAQKLGWMYIVAGALPFTVGLIPFAPLWVAGSFVESVLWVCVIVVTVYFVFFYKPTEQRL